MLQTYLFSFIANYGSKDWKDKPLWIDALQIETGYPSIIEIYFLFIIFDYCLESNTEKMNTQGHCLLRLCEMQFWSFMSITSQINLQVNKSAECIIINLCDWGILYNVFNFATKDNSELIHTYTQHVQVYTLWI